MVTFTFCKTKTQKMFKIPRHSIPDYIDCKSIGSPKSESYVSIEVLK